MNARTPLLRLEKHFLRIGHQLASAMVCCRASHQDVTETEKKSLSVRYAGESCKAPAHTTLQ